MFSEYKAYLNMFNKHKSVITEADDDENMPVAVEIDKDEEEKDTGAEEPKETEKKPAEKKNVPPVKKPAEKKPETHGDVDMKFSVDLATEFSNTINEFTTVCAKMVEARLIDKEVSDKFYDLYSKIKNLADAASKTE